MRRLVKKLEQVKGSIPPIEGGVALRILVLGPLTLHTHPFHEDYHDEGRGVRVIRHSKDDLSDLKIEEWKIDGSLNPENNLDWVQAFGKIFELKEYNDEKSFKLAILTMKGYATLWYKNLKKNLAREAKFEIKT